MLLARFPQIDLGDLTGFAGDGGVVLPAGERQLDRSGRIYRIYPGTE